MKKIKEIFSYVLVLSFFAIAGIVAASTITTILGTDTLSNSRGTINTNFSNLNTDKLETTSIDTCAELAAIMGDETGTCGSLVLSADPTLTGTLTFANATGTSATTTNLAIGSVLSTLLKTNSVGTVVPAILGTDYQNFSYLFPSNATSTILTFSNGLLAASSTLTGATTTITGNLLMDNDTSVISANIYRSHSSSGAIIQNILGQLVATFGAGSSQATVFADGVTASGVLNSTGGLTFVNATGTSVYASASSTFQDLNAGTLTVPSLTSALLLTNGSGVVAEYAGSACTNQAVTAVSALGVVTCATFSNFSYPFPSNATSSLLSFTGGIIANASSTIQDFNSASSTLGTVLITGNATGTNSFWSGLTATLGNLTSLFVGGKPVYPRWDDRMSIPSATTTDNMYRFGSCLESGGHSVTIDKVDSLIATTSSQNAVAEGISWNISIANNTGSGTPMTLFTANKTTTGTSTVNTFTTGFSTATIPAGYCYWFTPSTASTTQINQFYINLYGYQN